MQPKCLNERTWTKWGFFHAWMWLVASLVYRLDKNLKFSTINGGKELRLRLTDGFDKLLFLYCKSFHLSSITQKEP